MNYILICTPRAASKLNLSEVVKKYPKFQNIRIEIDTLIYINQMSGWTEEECDDVAYIVTESEFFGGFNCQSY
jgi:hypothetical protein